MTLKVGFASHLLIKCLFVSLFGAAFSECPFPTKRLHNGRYVYEAPNHSNMTIAPELYLLRFHCNDGFKLKGAKAITCHSDKWTDRVPRCLKIQCSDPPTIKNGHYVLDTGVSISSINIGSTATYTCEKGYELENDTHTTLKCHLFNRANFAEWKGTLPVCKKKESCPDPGVSVDGTREGDCCFTGEVLKFKCNDDYDLVGKDTIQCIPGGSWDYPRPLCRPEGDHCDTPPPIPHGVPTGEKEGDYYRPYDEVEIMCEPGFRYTGTTDYVLCEEETGWEEDFGECTEAFCDLPPPLVNGTIPEKESSNMTVFPFNFEVTYICQKGFRLIGDSWGFCDTRGWSGKAPYCEVIRCPDPGTPEHGSRVGSSFEIGDKITFRCFTGYEIIGSFERYCMPNGQWDGELARCDHENNYCPDPGIPLNGLKNSTNYDMGERIGFRCQGGYTLLGSNVRECLPDRTWAGEETKCMGPNDFDNAAEVGDILKTAVAEKEAEQEQKLRDYQRAQYATWHNGTGVGAVGRMLDLNFPGRLIFYFAFDVSGSVKKKNFRKSIEFAKAIVKKVGISEHGARAGALTFSSQKQQQFLPLDYETTEGVLAAFDALNYTGGGTSATSALTQIRQEMIPLTQAVLSKKGQKSIIFILTDGKANMGGDPEEEAVHLKRIGAEIYCIGITNSVLQDSLYKIASDPKKEHVFILQNYQELIYLIQEITNGTIDYSQCGLGLTGKLGQKPMRARIAGGGKATDPWPWMAGLFFVTPDAKPELKCGGSIIHEYYILTAAHCLNKNGIEKKENEVIVRLGILNIHNETNMQEFEVEKIFNHPKYEYPSFDYDIALIKLKRSIEFSAFVRPVCLPPPELSPNTDLYNNGQLTIAIGWGHAGVLRKGQSNIKTVDDLKEIILPIQEPDRCVKSLQENNLGIEAFTERMFCAGDGQGGNDTCLGDSGGPMMQSQQDQEGQKYWTQVGIVSWGIGCGLPNTYGYYSHVQRLRPWVIEITKANI